MSAQNINSREEFGRLIAAQQQLKGISNIQVCSKLGISPFCLGTWKRGLSFPRSPVKLEGLCVMLDIPIEGFNMENLPARKHRREFTAYFIQGGVPYVNGTGDKYPAEGYLRGGENKDLLTTPDAGGNGVEQPMGNGAGYPIGKGGEYGLIVGASAVMRETFQMLEKITRNPDQDTVILIEGESGTGKELFAKAVHFNSVRGTAPFVPVNITNVQEELVESQLFGHRRGSFTGAVENGNGFFKAAENGTLFLDEIGALGKTVQAKLLRVLQERTYYRVGETAQQIFQGRVVVATKENLELLVRERAFREDLFYRLHIIPLKLPPLREREGDCHLLFSHFVEEYNKKYRTDFDVHPTPSGEQFMGQYPFPGNVRELENLVRRAIFAAEERVVRIEEAYSQVQQAKIGNQEPVTKKEAFLGKVRESSMYERFLLLERAEFDVIAGTYFDTGGNYKQCARIVGVSRRTLYYRKEKWGMEAWDSLL